jgi:hypothetical protein
MGGVPSLLSAAGRVDMTGHLAHHFLHEPDDPFLAKGQTEGVQHPLSRAIPLCRSLIPDP